MAEVKIKPGSLVIEIKEGDQEITLNCPWMGPLTKVILVPQSESEEVLWAEAAATQN